MADGSNDKYRFKTFVGFPILHSLSGGIDELPDSFIPTQDSGIHVENIPDWIFRSIYDHPGMVEVSITNHENPVYIPIIR